MLRSSHRSCYLPCGISAIFTVYFNLFSGRESLGALPATNYNETGKAFVWKKNQNDDKMLESLPNELLENIAQRVRIFPQTLIPLLTA
jgi:hypothetical protein